MKITTERRISNNLPVRVFTTDGSPWDYAYDHEGNRVRTYNGVETNYYINGIDGRTEVVTDKASSWATYNLYGLDAIGQIRRTGTTWNRFYFLKVHLGSVRVIVDASGNVVAYDDYYPFGMQMPGRTQDSAAVDGRYKFTGKERDAETKYDYFGARYYDARIGRWLQVDPMAEKYPGNSPFVYSFNNPLRFYDPDGNYVVNSSGTRVYRTTVGQVQFYGALGYLPGASIVNIVDKLIRNDPSYRITALDFISLGTGKLASSLTGSVLKVFEQRGLKAWQSKLISHVISLGHDISVDQASGMIHNPLQEAAVDEMLFVAAELIGWGYMNRANRGIFELFDSFLRIIEAGDDPRSFVEERFGLLRAHLITIAEEQGFNLETRRGRREFKRYLEENKEEIQERFGFVGR